MRTLFLDIETLPADESDSKSIETLKYLYEKKLEKKNKKRESSEGVVVEEENVKKLSFEDYLKGTSFEGAFGRIICVALGVDDEEVRCYSSFEDGKWDEKKVLEYFWKVAGQCDLFVGHNLFAFDLPFLYQRSIILGVRPAKDLNFARYRSNPIFDIMQEWSKWGWSKDNAGLEKLALALSIPSPKDGIDGSEVAEFFKKGKVKEICDYCKRDVETTRAVYKKMNFIK